MNCRIGCRSSKRIWSMNVVFQSHGEPWAWISRHCQSFAWITNGVASKSGTGFGQAWCLHALSEGPKLRHLIEDENNEGFLQKTCWYSRAQSGKIGDLITANNHRYAMVVQDLATQWLQSYPCKSKSSQETQKNLMEFLEPTRKPKVIYTDNSLEFG